MNIENNINILGNFCGMRDVDRLSADAIQRKYGFTQADVMVLFGGSVIEGGYVLAKAMQEKIAKKYIIVGGAGHTTETLRQRVHSEYPDIETVCLPEAEVFQRYLAHVYGLQADYLETQSTNCGNNITYLLDMIRDKNIPCKSIILTQDATMQRRIDAGLRKYAPDDLVIINYAAYSVKTVSYAGVLEFDSQVHGMWTVERYVNLLMGEIPRLADDADGYGPMGKDFIAHVDIPETVSEAFEALKKVYETDTRKQIPCMHRNREQIKVTELKY